MKTKKVFEFLSFWGWVGNLINEAAGALPTCLSNITPPPLEKYHKILTDTVLNFSNLEQSVIGILWSPLLLTPAFRRYCFHKCLFTFRGGRGYLSLMVERRYLPWVGDPLTRFRRGVPLSQVLGRGYPPSPVPSIVMEIQVVSGFFSGISNNRK